ncbi:addiction module protein [Salinisphaera sp. P385]|uniref:Addiction module protein n=1 Tax=Spectribacter acetivorans TaxID=3075603 RepID=A0ABU3BAM8_9GAMM|nr:addiction module protein [Salinisphaera sp. P385]MDT0619524.1 addiction module protein [Salinisphaera sp. P385]
MSNTHTEKSPEQAALWLDEAERRDEELASGKVKGIPGEEVFARIESRYSKQLMLSR